MTTPNGPPTERIPVEEVLAEYARALKDAINAVELACKEDE